jgi:hypothetical protein
MGYTWADVAASRVTGTTSGDSSEMQPTGSPCYRHYLHSRREHASHLRAAQQTCLRSSAVFPSKADVLSGSFQRVVYTIGSEVTRTAKAESEASQPFAQVSCEPDESDPETIHRLEKILAPLKEVIDVQENAMRVYRTALADATDNTDTEDEHTFDPVPIESEQHSGNHSVVEDHSAIRRQTARDIFQESVQEIRVGLQACIRNESSLSPCLHGGNQLEMEKSGSSLYGADQHLQGAMLGSCCIDDDENGNPDWWDDDTENIGGSIHELRCFYGKQWMQTHLYLVEKAIDERRRL